MPASYLKLTGVFFVLLILLHRHCI